MGTHHTGSQLDTIEAAIRDIKLGKVVIVVDDEDRENEGDFLTAARNVTPEIVNFMATHGKGLICAPLIEEECDRLGLELMVQHNSAAYETPFTVSVDLIGHGCTTGISTHDRAKTVQALIDPNIRPEELGRPGHIFPLRAKKGGVLRRAGHTEAAIDLARLAGFEPAGVIVEIMSEDGSMARLPELKTIAQKFDLKLISIAELIAYRMRNESLIRRLTETTLVTIWGDFQLITFEQTTTDEKHIAIVKGSWSPEESIPVRVASDSFAYHLLDAIRTDQSSKTRAALQMIEQEGKGVIIFIQQKEKQTDWIEKLQGTTPQRPPKTNQRDYGIGAQILRHLNVSRLRLISDTSTVNRTAVAAYGLEVTEVIPFQYTS